MRVVPAGYPGFDHPWYTSTLLTPSIYIPKTYKSQARVYKNKSGKSLWTGQGPRFLSIFMISKMLWNVLNERVTRKKTGYPNKCSNQPSTRILVTSRTRGIPVKLEPVTLPSIWVVPAGYLGFDHPGYTSTASTCII